MYQIVDKCFFSKYLQPESIYEISAGYQCLRLRPYRGSHQFDWLRWCSAASLKSLSCSLPVAARKIANLPREVYTMQIKDTFYLLDPKFKGDPTTVHFHPQQPFSFLPEDQSLFKEAKDVPLEDLFPLTVRSKRCLSLPRVLRTSCGIEGSAPQLAISVFNRFGRQWVEIRLAKNSKVTPYPENDRISLPGFIPEISGITFFTKLNYSLARLNSIFPSDWDKEHLVGWYSEVRNAIIIENKPVECAVCGATIRSIDREHFYVSACDTCSPHLGHGGAFDAIKDAQNAVKAVEGIANMC